MVIGKIISVLIVDGDDIFRASLVHACSQEGLSVNQASDGTSAWKSFLNNSPHAVVTDLDMPNKEGINLLKHVKAISPSTPVYIVTGNLRGYSGEKALDLAAKIYHKPFNSIDLIHHIIQRCAHHT